VEAPGHPRCHLMALGIFKERVKLASRSRKGLPTSMEAGWVVRLRCAPALADEWKQCHGWLLWSTLGHRNHRENATNDALTRSVDNTVMWSGATHRAGCCADWDGDQTTAAPQ
jgi:hypothetical protein